MHGYQPIDLSQHANAGRDVFASPVRPPAGELALRGLPFRIGSGPRDDPQPFVRLGVGGHGGPLTLTFPWPARTIIVAHLLLDSDVMLGGPVGAAVAAFCAPAFTVAKTPAAIATLSNERRVVPKIVRSSFGSMRIYKSPGNFG